MIYGLLHKPTGKLLGLRIEGQSHRLDVDDNLPPWATPILSISAAVRRLGDEATGSGTFRFPMHLFPPEQLDVVSLDAILTTTVDATGAAPLYEELAPQLTDPVDLFVAELIRDRVAEVPRLSPSFMMERFNALAT